MSVLQDTIRAMLTPEEKVRFGLAGDRLQASFAGGVGTQVKGYTLQRELGAGAFGQVFLGRQEMLERDVAMKVIAPQYANHPEFIRRFEAEAQLVARLEHPFIVPLYDFWREPNGAYLVMRYLRGGTLRDRLKERVFTAEETATMLEQLASALTTSHRQGVVHRDIKPANIMFDEDANAYLTDFGIAKDLRSDSQMTQAGAMMGSPAYTSPEAIHGLPVTIRADIYSLGIVLFEALTGQHPYPGANIATLLYKHLEEPMPDLHTLRSDLPGTLNEVLQRATQKDPEARYESVASFASAFRNAIQGLPGGASATGAEASSPNAGLETTFEKFPEVMNPYKGLRPFSEADAVNFFGRDDLIEHLVGRMREEGLFSRFLAVIGPSGSGKSSVVKAGLIPRLRAGALSGSERAFVQEMVPSSDPFANLASALLRVAATPPESLEADLRRSERGLHGVLDEVLPDAASEFILVIDQFEEVFTQGSDEAQRNLFLDSLYYAVTHPQSRLRIIVTLRADFYDRPLLRPRIGTLMRERAEVVLPLSNIELEQAIRSPAQRVGLSLEPGLVTAIINDVADEPGALPLLQYALTELFERRTTQTLTLAAYTESGGVRGALARRAEELYRSLPPAEADVAEQLFLRLVTLGEGSEDTRRRAVRGELAALGGRGGAVSTVLELFGRHRLLTFDYDASSHLPTVEVAHEALLRNWQRLRDWLEESREEVRLQRRLTQASEEWLGAKRDPSYLATGSRLLQLSEWRSSTRLSLTETEEAFLNASLARHEEALAAEQARKRREQSLERRSRSFLLALMTLFAVATLVSLYLVRDATLARQEAEASATVAGQRMTEARSLALMNSAQLALRDNNLESAILLGLEANRVPNAPLQAQRILAEAAYAPGTVWRQEGDGSPLWRAVINPDGSETFVSSESGAVLRYDSLTGALLSRLELHDSPVRALALDPQGERLLSGSSNPTVHVWNLQDNGLIAQLEGHSDTVWTLAVSPDGSRALSGSADTQVILWDLGTLEPLARLTGHEGQVYAVRFSPDGSRAYSAADDGYIIAWDLDSFSEVGRSAKGDVLRDLAVSPDGTQLLSASGDRTVTLWGATTLQVLRRMTGHTEQVYSAAFSPDGRYGLSGSQDSSVILWDLATGAVLNRLEGHAGGVQSVRFAPDGRYAFSAAYDGSVRRWELQHGLLRASLSGHTLRIRKVALSPDGTQALSASDDMQVFLWDVMSGTILARLEGHTARVRDVRFSPDGTHALSASDDMSLILWNLADGSPVQHLTGHSNGVYELAFSPDGQRAVSGSSDGLAILWDLTTGAEIRRFAPHVGWVRGVSISPDGQTVLTASGEGLTMHLWDVESGQELRRYRGHSDWLWTVTFSPDGSRALSTASDNSALLWDINSSSPLRRLEGHSAPVYDALFFDETTAATASSDGTLRIWSLESGEELRRYDIGTAVWGLDYHPQTGILLSGGDDSILRAWQVSSSLDDLQAWVGANRYVREATCAERSSYGLEPLCPR